MFKMSAFDLNTSSPVCWPLVTVPSISDCSRLHHTAVGCVWSATFCKKIK